MVGKNKYKVVNNLDSNKKKAKLAEKIGREFCIFLYKSRISSVTLEREIFRIYNNMEGGEEL